MPGEALSLEAVDLDVDHRTRRSEPPDAEFFQKHFEALESQLASLEKGQQALATVLQDVQRDVKLHDVPGKNDDEGVKRSLAVDHAKLAEPWRAKSFESEVQREKVRPSFAPVFGPQMEFDVNHGSEGGTPRHVRQDKSLGSRPSVLSVLPQAVPPDVRELLQRRRRNRAVGQVQTSVQSAYKEDSWATAMVQSSRFEALSLAIITFNAIWLAVETDWNKADVLLHADVQFQVVENAFCAYFVVEWLIRFAAFRSCFVALHDPWFVFDSFLVVLMVFEIWVLTIVVLASTEGGASAFGEADVLRVLRLFRLTRLSRMVRLLRSLPELLFMLHGVVAASRSVGCTLGMLLGTVYVFGIAFTQLSEGTKFGAEHFETVPASMYTLLLDGAFMTSTKVTLDAIRQESIVCALLFGVVILTANLTIMNMLIGVLCDVVTKVSAKEKEEMDYTLVQDKLSQILMMGGLDPTDEEQRISKDDFLEFVRNEQATELLEKAGVNTVVLADFADSFFQSDKFGRKFDRRITLEEFVELIMKLRQGNVAALRDVAELKKYVRDECLSLKVTLALIKEGQRRMESKLERGNTARLQH